MRGKGQQLSVSVIISFLINYFFITWMIAEMSKNNYNKVFCSIIDSKYAYHWSEFNLILCMKKIDNFFLLHFTQNINDTSILTISIILVL